MFEKLIQAIPSLREFAWEFVLALAFFVAGLQLFSGGRLPEDEPEAFAIGLGSVSLVLSLAVCKTVLAVWRTWRGDKASSPPAKGATP